MAKLIEQGINDFTLDCDKYLTGVYKNNKYMRTYLYNGGVPEKNGHVVFRVPGATRGHIVLDKMNVIQDIIFYPETCFGESDQSGSVACYDKSILTLKLKYTGTKYDISKVTDLLKSLEGDE